MSSQQLYDRHRCAVHGWDGVGFCPTCCPPTADKGPAITVKPELRPKTSAERKGEPIVTGFLRYFPDAIAAASRLSVAGNKKHNPGEPLHWARNKSTDQEDCAGRHILTPDAIDPETGETELVAAFWRMGAAVQKQQERLLKEKGIMPYSGIVP